MRVPRPIARWTVDVNRASGSQPGKVVMLQVFVQGQALHTVDVSSETTVEALKEAVVPLEGISVEEQVLTYGGVPLENESLLVDCVQEMGTLNMTVRVVGGRYTRSLLPDIICILLSDIREVCIYTNLSFCVGKCTAPWPVQGKFEDRRQR